MFNKLVSKTVLILFGFASSAAFAEYYVVCSPPVLVQPVQYVYVEPRCHVVHHKPKHHKRHHVHHKYYHPPRSHAEVVIYPTWNVPPPVCCDYNCTPRCYAPCSHCVENDYFDVGYARTSAVYYVPYSMPYYDYDFDFDRRTADDLGADLQVD